MLKNIAVVCLLAFAVTPALAQGEKPEKVLKIISSLPRTGSANAQTTTMVNGIQLAIDEVNGKVGDYTIVYEDMDDASPQRGNWDPAVEAQNANKAARDESVIAYIGTFNSGASIPG